MIIKLLTATAAILCLSLAGAGNAFAVESESLDELLSLVKQGRVTSADANSAQLMEFQASGTGQRLLLEEANAEQARQELHSEELERVFEANDVQIMALEEGFEERLGDLKDLFSVLHQAAGDTRGNFDDSVTQVQFRDRSDWLSEFAQKMTQANKLATMEEIERLWFELQREMSESGKIVSFDASVVDANGEQAVRRVTRIGSFNIVSDGKYLEYIPETGRLVELQRQPDGIFTRRAAALESASTGLQPFGIDPSRGQLLGMLVQTPSMGDRVAQGKQVGYAIIALGIFGLGIAIWRLIVLSATSAAVRRQSKNLDQPGNNPLGRVLKVAHDSPGVEIEQLELKLIEVILKETPRFNSMLPMLKIVSVVAPLMGLLGTVYGMIITFQAITLYGAGDPKMMAGGISTALVTTVLGLIVAIPTVFLYTLVSSRARRLTQVLEQETAGMLSELSELSQRNQRPA